MSSSVAEHLRWIDGQRQRMCQLVRQWASVNSGSHNVAGLDALGRRLEQDFAPLGAQMEHVSLPPQKVIDRRGHIIERPLGRALVLRKRPQAPNQVFLGIHMDTVYGPDHPFQDVTLDGQTMRGPGVTDAKGGLAVMLVAAEALERTPWAGQIGWRMVINPDEEIGSPGSGELLTKEGRGCCLGLIFEPALENGALVCRRRGSGNFAAVIRGRSAHAGRDFAQGRSAIHAMADLIVALRVLGKTVPGATVNVGIVEGGTAVNVVADMAIARFNIRFDGPEQQEQLLRGITDTVHALGRTDGISVELHGGITAPAKPLSDGSSSMRSLMAIVDDCGRDLGIPIAWAASGGVSDGNRLAAAGMPVVDSLGPCGGGIHSPGEFLLTDSLPERAKLAALVLMKLASGHAPWPARS